MRISDWSSAGCSSDLAGQLESADLDFARGLAFALYGHGIDEEFVMSRIENMRRQFHGHAIIDCFYAFPGRDGFEQKFGCVHAAQMIDWQARKRVVSGKSVSVLVALGGRSIIKKKTMKTYNSQTTTYKDI